MRASLFLIVAVLIAAFFAVDAYKYDGHYRKAAMEEIDHQSANLLGKGGAAARKTREGARDVLPFSPHVELSWTKGQLDGNARTRKISSKQIQISSLRAPSAQICVRQRASLEAKHE